MKAKRYTEEQIVGILREYEAGMPIAELVRKYGIGKGAIYRWRLKYGGMEVDEVRRTKQLEEENSRLKRLLADSALEISAMRELLKKF
jgi:putative transposase